MKTYFKWLTVVTGVTCSFTTAFAQDQLDQIKKDLKSSNSKLTAQREKVADERISLSSQLTQTQDELITKRRLARLARMSDADRKESMRQLELNAAAQVREKQFLSNQVGSYTGKFAATLLKGEVNVVGGAVVDASGVSAEGDIKTGKVAMIGPAMWFSANDQSFQGEVVLAKANRLATVVSEGDDKVTQLFAGNEVTASVDLTGGKARALANIGQSPLDL